MEDYKDRVTADGGKMQEITYETNPNRRCMYCKGREVFVYMNGHLIDVNLEEPTIGFLRCKDIRECQRNLESENTQVIVHEKGFGIVNDYDEPIMEVEFNDDFQGW